MAHTRTWTAAAAEVQRERTRQIARIGNNLNQIARWANANAEPIDAVEIIAHLVYISQTLDKLAQVGDDGRRCTLSSSPAGRARPGPPLDYLLGELDAAGNVRDGVEVLRGDPGQVAAVADALDFHHKYTSGVIAWAPEDNPTDAQIEAVLDKFEKTAWAGLAPDRYAWTAVEHRERGGGVHVHILAARCDLETGKSLNIAPPRWEKTFGPLRDGFNHTCGWSRPDDPARARAQQPGHRALIDAAKLRAGLAVEADPRELIRDYLLQRVELGLVRSRADVVAALKETGFDVPRQGDSYVTARDPGTGKRWRLKGALYEHDFQPERLGRPAAAEAGDRPAGDRDGQRRPSCRSLARA